jgi:spore germination cell wall hydrolase CwlJ-like protein
MTNTKFYLAIGTAVFVSNVAYNLLIEDRISSVESEVMAIHNDVQEIKQAVLETNPVAITYNKNDVECLARNIYYEAGVESMAGKIAVGNITVNRVKTKYWGRHICDVVYSKNQFSWTKDRKRAWATLKGPAWADSRAAAEAVLKGGVRVKQLKTALFYHADYVSPHWRDNSKRVLKVGRHIFYTQAKGNSIKL